ncbi:uncharacterized protein LOC103130503 isoform X1 [Poecilia formosa]|uniref:uncharacterized protein LOC103130503 isoform X1 n=1 Tax=Poecilia formosa TaxID=48698 RepID=UPI0007B83694|nr:PREDICTED: uncharacterized protein LOC103130503 isoform X1 [Poecilia formosa]
MRLSAFPYFHFSLCCQILLWIEPADRLQLWDLLIILVEHLELRSAAEMQTVVTNLALQKLQSYFAIVVIFTYSILLRSDFECSCKRQLYYCIIYAVTPGLIATVLMLWSNRLFQRTCSYRSRFKSFICRQVLKAALVGLLWVAFLLIDGDWWACCFNKLSEQQAGLPCKAAAKRSDEERETMAAIKTTSRVSGCWLLFLIVFSGAMSSWTRWRSSCSKGATQYEETLYYKLVLEEEEAVLKEVLRESIRTKLTQQIRTKCEDNWKECFNVAEEVMKNQRKQPEQKDKNVELDEISEEASRLVDKEKNTKP